MSKICRRCGRVKHAGLCDMATLDDGRTVHASRIKKVKGIEMVEGVRVKNRWIKPEKNGLDKRFRVSKS